MAKTTNSNEQKIKHCRDIYYESLKIFFGSIPKPKKKKIKKIKLFTLLSQITPHIMMSLLCSVHV